MNYSEFKKIQSLVEEREQLKQGLSLLREMTVKSTSLQNHEVRLVFTETGNRDYYPVPDYHESAMAMMAAMRFKLPDQKPQERSKGMVVLDYIMLLKVAGAMADHWEERIREINTQIKALGMEP